MVDALFKVSLYDSLDLRLSLHCYPLPGLPARHAIGKTILLLPLTLVEKKNRRKLTQTQILFFSHGGKDERDSAEPSSAGMDTDKRNISGSVLKAGTYIVQAK